MPEHTFPKVISAVVYRIVLRLQFAFFALLSIFSLFNTTFRLLFTFFRGVVFSFQVDVVVDSGDLNYQRHEAASI